jgi:hypothetical protein
MPMRILEGGASADRNSTGHASLENRLKPFKNKYLE